MPTIEATDEEVAVLHQLLHRAVLHSGMEAAEAACLWKRKLIAAAQQDNKANGKTEMTVENHAG